MCFALGLGVRIRIRYDCHDMLIKGVDSRTVRVRVQVWVRVW